MATEAHLPARLADSPDFNMRRWTIILVPHDTEAPKSYSVTERALRVAATLGGMVLLVAAIGVGSTIAQLGRVEARVPAAVAGALGGSPSVEVAALRQRVGAIQGLLDTIRHEDARLRSAAGDPGTDNATLLKRFLARLPRFLRDPGVVHPPQPSGPARGVPGARSPAVGATEVADSLLAHAAALAEQYRSVGPAGIRLDTLDVLSLRPESLQVAARAPDGTLKQAGRVLRWAPTRGGAMLAGFDAEVARAHHQGAGIWQIDLRAAGGLLASVSAPGQPAVREGDRVRADQPVMLVSPGTAGTPGHASYELRRNGISLDPTYPRSLGPSAPRAP